jgi:hypothetical protein
MRRATAVLAAVAVWAAAIAAQTVPGFAGKWTLVPDAAAAGGFPGLGTEAIIVQDATTLTITRTTQFGEFKSVYKLDGTESRNTLNFGGNPMEQLSKVKVEGTRLTITTSMNIAGTPSETVTSLELDPSGALLVESRRPDFQGGGQPITTKSTYKKN